jgi:hypothetical protein
MPAWANLEVGCQLKHRQLEGLQTIESHCALRAPFSLGRKSGKLRGYVFTLPGPQTSIRSSDWLVDHCVPPERGLGGNCTWPIAMCAV